MRRHGSLHFDFSSNTRFAPLSVDFTNFAPHRSALLLALGLFGNLAFNHNPPPYFQRILTTLGNAFAAGALLTLGIIMISIIVLKKSCAALAREASALRPHYFPFNVLPP